MEENLLQSAPVSPRMDNGILKWFYGDTFAVEMLINLVGSEVDDEGNYHDDIPIEFSPEDQIVVSFYNSRKKLVHSFVCTNINEDPSAEDYHLITLNFIKDVSLKFLIGRYTYCVKYFHMGKDSTFNVDITTICASNKVEVYPCH